MLAQTVDFNSPRTFGSAPGQVDSTVVADFNGDGKPDIAVAILNQGFEIPLGNGDGTFQALPPVNLGSNGFYTNSLTVGDFNGDGKADLAVTDEGDQVAILLGNGDGTFQPPVNYTAGSLPSSVTAADFNGDGKLDLVVTNYDSKSVSVLLGNGDGTFQPAV